MIKKILLGLSLLAVCLTSIVYAGGEVEAGEGVETISNAQTIGVLRKVGTYYYKKHEYAVTELPNGTIFVYGASQDHMQSKRDSLESKRESAAISGHTDAEMWQPGLNGWKSMGTPPECKNNRLLQTMTPLPDNRVLIAGGLCDGPKMLNDTSLYLPYTKLSLWNGNTQKWETAPSLHVARLYHTASLLSDGSVLLVGGEPDPALYTPDHPVLDVVERFHDGEVSLVSSLHVARAHHTATSLDNGALLVAGGVGKDGKALGSVELWDPVGQSWHEVAPLNTPRYNHSAVRLTDGSVMVAGGIGLNGQPLASVELWSPTTGKWSTISPLLYPLQGHSAAPLANGDVLIAGGLSIKDKATAQAERWDSKTGHWSPAGAMVPVGVSHYDPDPNTYSVLALVPHPDGSAHVFTRSSILEWTPAITNIHAPYGERDYFAATRLQNGRVMISGGFLTGLGQLTLMDAVEIYDPLSGHFSLTGRMHQRRFMHSSLLLDDGRVLVVGGWVWAANPNGASIANYPEVWDPQTGEWALLEAIHFNPSERVHMARLQDGRVLFFGSDESKPAEDGAAGQANYRTWLWNPSNGQVEQKMVKMRPRSGAAVAILADGRVMRVGGYVRTFIPAAPCQLSQDEKEDNESECVNETAYWNEELDKSAEIWDSRTGETRTVTPPPQWDVHDGKTLVLRNGNVLFVAYRPPDIIKNPKPSDAPAWLWDVHTERWQPFPALPVEFQWELLELADGTLVTGSHQLPEGATEWLPIQAVIQKSPRIVQTDAGALLSISTVPPYAAALDMASRQWQILEQADRPPTWMTVPALAALQDGRMMAVGRTERNPKATFSAYIWNPVTDTWSSAGRPVNQAHNSSMIQLPSGSVLHVGTSDDNRLLCEIWDAVNNLWQACGDYPMQYEAHVQIALGLLDDGRVVAVANTEEAFVFEPSTMQWTRHSIEWDTRGMTWGAPIRSDTPLARISDTQNTRWIDISPVAGQYWQRITGGGGYSVSFSDRSGKVAPGRDSPPALLWDPKGKLWAYVLLPNKMGRDAEFLPDGCALSWTPLTMFNPGTGKVTALTDPGIGMQSWEASMVVLRDGTVVIAGLPDANNNGFFHRKASCNGFAALPADAALIPAKRYERESPAVSRPAVHVAPVEVAAGWRQKLTWKLLEYRWIILALMVPIVLYIVIRFGLMPLFRRIGLAMPEDTRQRLNRPMHWSFSFVTRIVVYGTALMIALPMLWSHLVLSSIDNSGLCVSSPAQCLDKETHLLPSVPTLERDAQGNKVKPSIPCRYVGIWSSRRGHIMFRIELKDDGTYAMAPNEYGVGDPRGYTGYWMVQGESMVWRHNQAYTIEPDINPIITESDTRFQLVEVNGMHTQYELIKAVESTRCTP